MGLRIALAGNPNSGKTTVFNALTGSTQYVGNWPGVTVEKKEGKLRGRRDVEIVDLPGIYSLSPYSLEEVVARNYLLDEKPDAVINIVDASNIERNLYLTTQLLETGIPVVIALNMMDVVSKSGDTINTNALSAALGCPVVETAASRNEGLDALAKAAVEAAGVKNGQAPLPLFSNAVEAHIRNIEEIIKGEMAGKKVNTRWLAIKLFEQDEKVLAVSSLSGKARGDIKTIVAACEKEKDDDAESIITTERYDYIAELTGRLVRKKRKQKLTGSDKIDKIVTNRWLALPIFFLIMWGVYYVSIQSIGDMTIGWVETLIGDWIGGAVSNGLTAVGAAEWLHSLIVDGIIGGVGSVLVFVPQLMILFFFISILEDCGYMARVAFIMDRIFRRFGLSGKSFIPMLIGTGCSVPAIMASRTIENDKDRKMTIMLTPFIPCGAKLPVFALFVGAFFPTRAWVAPSMYLLGIVMVILSGIILKKTKPFRGDPAPFVMELPPYRMPQMKGVLIHMWERGKAFMIKAGTVIFVASGVLWFLQSFNWSMQMVDASESMLASIGRVIAPIFIPLGFGEWQSAVATVTGLLAKEVVVSTFGILYGIADATEGDPTLLQHIGQIFNPASGYAFMVFTLLAAPCFAAIGAMKREFNSWKWTLGAMAYQTGTAYVMALLAYQIGRLFL